MVDNMYIKGVGMTNFGTSDKHSWQLAYEATLEALEDAQMSFNDIDAVVCSTLEWFFSIEKQRHFPSMLSSIFKTNKPIVRVPEACAGGGSALWFANQLTDYNNILVVGAEKLMTCKTDSITEEFMMAAESRWEQPEGLNFPGQNALVTQEYMLKYPETTTDHLALIAFKNHSNALLNPKAKFYGTKISLEKIKSSPMVCSPLRLFDCSISVDGAAAAIISKDKTDISIVGSDLCTDYLPTFEREENTSWDASTIVAKNAYSQAGIDASSINVAELHDAFTIVELIGYEDMGFSKPGQSYKKIEDGYFNLDGKLPINPCGGLKAKGHPVTATGLSQIYELVKQLRNKAEERQVSSPKYGLAHNIGGAGGTVTCNILKKIGGY
jgi:acetyl-CoA C-acetyltransferase